MNKRTLATVALAFVALILFLNIVGLLYLHINDFGFYRPLYTETPQAVSNRIEGIQGPALHQGDDLITTAIKCNYSGHTLFLDNVATWAQEEPYRTVVPYTSTNDTPFPSGCKQYHFSNPTPPTLRPGVWQLEGTSTASEGPFVQEIFWESEPFTVVAK